MEVAIWIIAICEVIRALQNAMQLTMYRNDKGQRDNAYAEFVKSLNQTDREFVKRMAKEIDEAEKHGEVVGVKLNLDGTWTEMRKGDECDP